MVNKEGVIITTRGLQLLTKLAASAGKLEFSNVKVGTGRLSEDVDPSGLTHLVTYKMDGLIADYGYDSDSMDGYVVMQINNTNIASGFIMTEIGLYAMDPDLGEILYAYVDLSNDPNHIMPAENGRSKTVQMKLHIIVGEVKELTATINSLAQVTREVLSKEMETVLNPEFDDSGAVEGITNKTTLLANIISKMPLIQFMRNVKAGFKLALYAGELVNNCVTDRSDLPLSAAQGKVLMDLYTVLNTKIDDKSTDVDIKQGYMVLSQGAYADRRTILYTAPYDCIVDVSASVNSGLKYFNFIGVSTTEFMGITAISGHFKLTKGGVIDLWTQSESAKNIILYYSLKATKCSFS